MSDGIEDPTAYAARRAEEQRLYRDDVDVHNLPKIFHYWSNRHIRPKLEAFGFRNPLEMFHKYAGEQCARRAGSSRRFVSFGSGNCDLEIGLASAMRAQGHTDFMIDCVDLNAAMLERGRASAAGRQVEANLNFVQADFNDWTPEHEYDAVLGNQALHHVLKLERLLAQIKSSLKPEGSLIVSEMVGRNGHQRWPEALEIVREFWRLLPPSYRFNHKLHRYEEMFGDWDCSGDGFEAIRSQDILPLLIQNFHFRVFIAFANVIDPFVDRGFGYNFDARGSWDRDFIDAVHQRDEKEFASGVLKPTHILGVLGTKPDLPLRFHEPLTPRFCVRDPAFVAPVRQTSGDKSPYEWTSWPHDPQSELEITSRRLKEAEDRIQERDAMMVKLQAWGDHLFEEWKEKAAWALELQREVEEKATSCSQLNQKQQLLSQELEGRTAWAFKLEDEAESLDTELNRRTAWAQGLDRELQVRNAQTRALTQDLERLAWARPLDRVLHTPLHAAFRALRWVRNYIRRR